MNNATVNHPSTRRPRILFVILFLAVLAGSTWALIRFVDRPAQAEPRYAGNAPDAAQHPASSTPDPFLDRLGIEVQGANLSVGGSRLDVRYRVVDPLRAVALTNKAFAAQILDAQGNPLRLPNAPEPGPVQSQSGQIPKPGYVYSHFFPNPDQAIKPGDHVILRIGNLRQELVVR